MCGILCVLGDLQEKKSLPETMLQLLKHCGPDDRGSIKGESNKPHVWFICVSCWCNMGMRSAFSRNGVN